MEGYIKTYLPTKGYGFISGNDGKDYFFHVSSVKKLKDSVDEGKFVAFEEGVTPKGYKANNVEILSGQTSYLELVDEFYWSKREVTEKYEVLYRTRMQIRDKDIDTARALLKHNASTFGFNGFVNVTYYKNNLNEGNYIYSEHYFEGDTVLIAQRKFTKDKNLSAIKNSEAEKKKDKIIQYYESTVLEKIEEEKDEDVYREAKFCIILLILWFLFRSFF